MIRAALIQCNASVGALTANADAILRLAREAAANGADLIVFPELALSGGPLLDLTRNAQFIGCVEQEAERLAAALPPGPVIVIGAPVVDANGVHNAALIVQGGTLRATLHSESPAQLLAMGPQRTGVIVGAHHPATLAAFARNVDFAINITAAPYYRDGLAEREAALRAAAQTLDAPLLHCNLVGGQDELVFEGASGMVDATGVIARAKQFEEDTLYVELPKKSSKDWTSDPNRLPRIGKTVELAARATETADTAPLRARLEPPLTGPKELYTALVTGLRDYVNKNGFRDVVLGLSGGVDSALVATLAMDALGARRVHGVTMPSHFSSVGTRSDAHQLAKNLGISIVEAPIQSLYERFVSELSPLWPGREEDTTEENLQARIRGIILMALSNKFGWLVLATGNKSEVAAGYCTLYGDTVGGFAVLKDVTKTRVYALARWRNQTAGRELIPEATLTRAPSAELRENQTDQDSLPPYEVLDNIIERYIEQDVTAERLVADGFDAATVKHVVALIGASEYKRQQAAPGVKVTRRAFGTDRRMPVTNRYRDRLG